MTTKAELQYQITELKMDYINLQGDVEKMESLGHSDSVEKAVIRLENMEKRLAELNKQLLELELKR
ncbi:MAG: SE1832 family protein [Lysinibacillus sp.]